MALQGFCLTIGIELALAADVRIAAYDAKFSRIDVQRGIYAFGWVEGMTSFVERRAGVFSGK